MPLTAGSRLGPYEIQSTLGAGGMGEVYKARDTRLDRTVAIKILPDTLAADPQFRERFDREAKAISQLRISSCRSIKISRSLKSFDRTRSTSN
jgi:serine/threonine protein kinase